MLGSIENNPQSGTQTSPIISAEDGARAIAFGDQHRTFLRQVRLSSFSEEIAQKSRSAKTQVRTRDKGKSRRGKPRSPFWQAILPSQQASGRTGVRAAKESQSGVATNKRLDIGGWLNLPYGIHTTVSLVVEFFDGEETQAFKVDSVAAKGAVQVLLSGSIDLLTDSPVETVKIYCYGIDDKSVWIENFQCAVSSL